MSKNPFVNAVSASLYIVLIVFLMRFVLMPSNAPENILIPIMMLSLFVLSVAMMGSFFVCQPLRLYLDGEKKRAVDLFWKTIGVFAIITLLIIIVFLTA